MSTAISLIEESRTFSLSEFPEGELELASPEIIRVLLQVREVWGKPIYPSRAPGALARRSGNPNSQHYAVGRLSTAIDIFPKGDPGSFWLMLCGFPEIGGIGVYSDTNRGPLQPGPMFHIDTRTGRRVYWCRVNGEYIYPSEPGRFWSAIGEIHGADVARISAHT